MRRSRRAPPAPRSQLRIIGGRWRGRRISFRAGDGLRPTPDRVRETLFNWLQPVIEGARCLDLFCGSGALGLEALSRGAASASFVDRSAAVAEDLRHNLQQLGAGDCAVFTADALQWLAQPHAERFHLVFLDPPFRLGLAARAAEQLHAAGALAPGAHVYVESAADEAPLQLPAGWSLLRDKTAGQVSYRLYRAAGG